MKLIFSAFSLIVFFYISFASTPVVAHETDEIATEAANVASSEAKMEVGYTLPYPGILPDNPLHFIKAARDRIVGILINDSIKKAEFNLLTSDKRVYAAVLLARKDKDELAIDTLSKSNNYFHEAIGAASVAKKMGKSTDAVIHNLELSVKKHQESFSEMEKIVDKKFSSQLQTEHKRLDQFEKEVSSLKHSK